MFTQYQKELKAMKRSQVLSLVFSFIAMALFVTFILVLFVYSWDNGMSRAYPEYRDSNSCIFQSNCE